MSGFRDEITLSLFKMLQLKKRFLMLRFQSNNKQTK